MNLILILTFYSLYLIQFIDSKKVRFIMGEEIYPYNIDKSVIPFSDRYTLEHFILEQTDDDRVEIDGYFECLVSMDPTLPMVASVRTKYFEKSIWYEGPIRLLIPNACQEFINPSRFYYNITKLWTNCPAQKGDKWVVEHQFAGATFDVPTSFTFGPWRAYVLITQGIPGFEKVKYGFGFDFEAVVV